MNRYETALLIVCSIAGCSACATKSYVRGQETPLIEKVNQIDTQTAQNTNAIEEVDARTTRSIQESNARADEALQHATAAQQQASRAQLAADGASNEVQSVSNTLADIDNYKVVGESSVHFGVDQYALSNEDAAILDKVGSQLSGARDYIVTVVGTTDSQGNKNYNYFLSARRAAAVRSYLATKCSVPSFKIHVVGLGADKPVASDHTASGRAQNRRADVQVFSSSAADPAAQSAVNNTGENRKQ